MASLVVKKVMFIKIIMGEVEDILMEINGSLAGIVSLRFLST